MFKVVTNLTRGCSVPPIFYQAQEKAAKKELAGTVGPSYGSLERADCDTSRALSKVFEGSKSLITKQLANWLEFLF